MKNRYKALRNRMLKFNQWELTSLRNLHPIKRLEQFLMLFEIAQSCNEQKRFKMHEEHLKSLVEGQKRLKRCVKDWNLER